MFMVESNTRCRLTTFAVRIAALLLMIAFSWLCLHPVQNAGASEGSCGQPSGSEFSSQTILSDCRVYELVNPPYKEGLKMMASNSTSYASDGGKVIFSNYANLADSLGAGEQTGSTNVYLATRTPTGWRTTSLNPSMTQFVGQIPLAAEADNGETLWMQHKPDQSRFTRDLYYSRAGSDEFAFIGPLMPPSAPEEASNTIETFPTRLDRPVAATADYKHVVLEAASPAAYWQTFDHTQKNSSLYEYTGTGNQAPTLVGVIGEKGSHILVGECGIELGSNTGGSTFNAISSDGETIFFTTQEFGTGGCSAPAPLVRAIYARVHGSPKSAEPAETINVSESKCTLGALACGGQSGSNFEGASWDGKKVFFTSTQKLTNDAVDGTASGDASRREGCAAIVSAQLGCNLYESDIERERTSLKLISGGDVLGVLGIAENGARVYFVARVIKENENHESEEQSNLYVYDSVSGTTRFIATLNQEADQEDWRREFGRPAEVAGESGRFLLFASAMPGLTPDDSSSKTQLYVYDAVTSELARITQGEAGYNNDGNGVSRGVIPELVASIVQVYGDGTDFKSTTHHLNIAEDGKTVFFTTAGELSPYATSAADGCLSVYEFHTAGALKEGEVHLISDGRDTQLVSGRRCGAKFEQMDEDGANVLFSTSDPLVRGDVDGLQQDVYDARVDGGFYFREAAMCGSGECEASSSRPPSMPVAGSTSSGGEVSRAAAVINVGQSQKRRTALARALRACRAKLKRRRHACERLARRHITPVVKTSIRPARKGS